MNTTCEYCKKKLRPFTKTSDWTSRIYHKTCYKLKQTEIEMQMLIEDYINSNKISTDDPETL